MADPIVHSRTGAAIDSFCNRPAHALLIHGPDGIGKRTVADVVMQRILQTDDLDRLKADRARLIIDPPGTSIGIDEVRSLQAFVKLKMPGTSHGIRRIICIEHAERMGSEAQNALLKLLEEPPTDTLLLLTVANLRVLLPTIRSRAQLLAVTAPAIEAVRQYFTTSGFAVEAVERAVLLSGGLPGLTQALLADQDHPLAQAAIQARNLLQADTFGRLVQVDALAKQRETALQLTHILGRMAGAALQQQAAKQAPNEALRRWQHILAAALEAETALLASAQTKLTLMNLMLKL